MNQVISEAFYSFVTLLAMVNPVEAAAAFATLTSGRSPANQARIALRAAVVGLGILLAFGYVGEALLKAIGVSLASFKVAGGLLLLKVGFDMVFAQRTSSDAAESEKSLPSPTSDPSVFPLAIPIISGPGALTASVALVNRAHENQVLTDLAFVLIAAIVFAITYLAMRGSQRLTRVLGKTGVDATGRLVGIIVAAIAVQLIVDGVSPIARGLFH
ncbi:MAG TPA: MarC family protein [Candidatus Tumulicola sp.]